MIIHGYVKNYRYSGDGTLYVQVRIPSIHGPYRQQAYEGRRVRNYVLDEDLPYYPSLLLPHMPNEGEVVAITSTNKTSSQFLVLGLTGGSYQNGLTDLEE